MTEIVELAQSLLGVSERTGEHLILFGLTWNAGELQWLAIEGSDGRTTLEPYGGVRIEFRYDQQRGWYDVGLGFVAEQVE